MKRENLTIVIAPTGLGKTLAAILPFVGGTDSHKLTTRIIYSLPIRALSKGVYNEFINQGVEAVIHHGEEPESNIFSERAIITTVDQYFSAFAGAPISWSSSVSHAATGAVLTSYTVFDEVHLLNPKNALQLLFAILKLRNRWNLPTTIMTATLPNSVIEFLKNTCGLEKVEATEEDINERDSWREVNLTLHEKELDVDGVVGLAKEYYAKYRKVIIFINTVERAINLYKRLKEETNLRNRILLAHSRFSKEHRKRIEDEIYAKFGRNSDFEGILVTTQVAEAGLNISAPLVITELAPMDSLIQRAGRCARFRENSGKVKGEIIVVKPRVENGQRYAPYFDKIFVNKNGKTFIKKRGKEKKSITLSELTWIVLRKECEGKSVHLDWFKEKELINICLGTVYKAFIEGRENVDVHDMENSIFFEDKKFYEILNESIEILLGGN